MHKEPRPAELVGAAARVPDRETRFHTDTPKLRHSLEEILVFCYRQCLIEAARGFKGSAANHLELAARAASAKDIINQPKGQIHSAEDKPVAPNKDRQGRAQNRRVVVRVLS